MPTLYLQSLDPVKWNPVKHYEMAEIRECDYMTITDAGEAIFSVRKQKDTWEAQWYDQKGTLIHTLPRPVQCGAHRYTYRLLAIKVDAIQHVAIACPNCHCIFIGSLATEAWSMGWQASGEEGSVERKKQPKPWSMWHGKPGQIIARDVRGDGHSVCVFDIKNIPFRLVMPEIKLGMMAVGLCYCDLPGIGDAIAVTGGLDYNLCMFSLAKGDLIWSIGERDDNGDRTMVAGAKWVPYEICSDRRGRLYVADNFADERIIVLSAVSGSVLQVIHSGGHYEKGYWMVEPGVTLYGPDIKYEYNEARNKLASGSVQQKFKDLQMGRPLYLCWHENSTSIVLYHTGYYPAYKRCFSYLNLKV